jgi:hypothetical protein
MPRVNMAIAIYEANVKSKLGTESRFSSYSYGRL